MMPYPVFLPLVYRGLRESEIPEDRQADRRDRGEEDSQDRGAVQLKPATADRSVLGCMKENCVGAVRQVSVIDVDSRLLPALV